jgi:hypothetical protein
MPCILRRAWGCIAGITDGDKLLCKLRAGAGSVVALRDLYPSTSPHAQESLPVSAGHTLHWRAYGNPRGVPALFVHGGPGAGCYPNHA